MIFPAKNGAKLTVTSPAFAPGGGISVREHSNIGGNVFPGLSWTAGHVRTKAYVVILQDLDAMSRGGTHPFIGPCSTSRGL